IACSLMGLMLAGCPTSTEQKAMEGVDALRRCDVRAAHTAFIAAHEMEPDRADVALAFALTDLGTLPGDPALTALAPRLGFDRAIDASIIWGQMGLLDRLEQRQSCTDISNYLRAQWPHPVLRDGTTPLAQTIDPTLTLGDMRAALIPLMPRLQ